MEFFQKTQNYLVPIQMQARIMDIKYFLSDYEPKNIQDKNLIDDLKKNMLQYQIGGILLSLAFVFSINRLLFVLISLFINEVAPQNRWMKIPINLAIVCVGQGMGAVQGIEVCSAFLKPLQKSLTEDLDLKFFKHLLQKYRDFPQLYRFNQEHIFLNFMTLTEYQVWQQKNQLDFSQIGNKKK